MESVTQPNFSCNHNELREREVPRTVQDWSNWLDRREHDLRSLVAAGQVLLLTADRDRPDLTRTLVRRAFSCRVAIAWMRLRLRLGLLPHPERIERAQGALFMCMRDVIDT